MKLEPRMTSCSIPHTTETILASGWSSSIENHVNTAQWNRVLPSLNRIMQRNPIFLRTYRIPKRKAIKKSIEFL